VALAVILVLIVVSLVFVVERQYSNAPIRVGVAAVTSDESLIRGKNIVHATQLAIDEVNAGGGINGRPLQLVVEDSGTDATSGLAAVQKLVNSDGVKYVIDGMTNDGTLAAAPFANANRVVMMTPVAGGSNIDNAGDYIFRTANSNVLAARDLALAMVVLGYKRVAVVSDNTAYSSDLVQNFEETINTNNAKIMDSEMFPATSTDYASMIRKIKAAHPDSILMLSETGTDTANLIAQARKENLDAAMFTDFSFAANGEARSNIATSSYDGVYFADPSYDESGTTSVAFFQKYQDTYHAASPFPSEAAASYDDIMLLSNALNAVGDDSGQVKDWLTSNVKDYHGLMGTYSLDANGNSDLGFTIKVFRDGKPVLVQ